ncbi:MAG: twin-arginine translocase subunit TatC [candidate division Zixibacteria bacterium]
MTVNKVSEMPFLEHLEELRWRIIKILAALLLTAIACYTVSDFLFVWLRFPLEKAIPDGSINLNFLKVGEGFTVRIKLSILAGIFVSIPITIYQIWQFVMPGLYQTEKRFVIPIVFVSSILFLAGAAICFIWVLPFTIRFLIGIAPENVEPVLTVNEYLNFVMWTTLSYGIVFQLPIVSLFLGKMGIINGRMLGKGRRYALVGIAAISAIVTPPDIFSMTMMGMPLYLLYEISILILYIIGKGGKKEKLAG